jgi:hypothetical protein
MSIIAFTSSPLPFDKQSLSIAGHSPQREYSQKFRRDHGLSRQNLEISLHSIIFFLIAFMHRFDMLGKIMLP